MIYFYCAKKLLFILTSPHLLTKKREQEIKGKRRGLNSFYVKSCFAVKELDKNLSGKSDEREVKICKNWLFTLHSLFFILRKTSFCSAKP
jgi:hypothetical protein